MLTLLLVAEASRAACKLFILFIGGSKSSFHFVSIEIILSTFHKAALRNCIADSCPADDLSSLSVALFYVWWIHGLWCVGLKICSSRNGVGLNFTRKFSGWILKWNLGNCYHPVFPVWSLNSTKYSSGLEIYVFLFIFSWCSFCIIRQLSLKRYR